MEGNPMSEPKKKKGRHPGVTLAISLVLLLMSGYFLINVFSETRITYTLLTDINEAKKEYEALKQETELLVNERDKLQDPNYVENYARGQYLITKEGEAIYHLPAVNDNGD